MDVSTFALLITAIAVTVAAINPSSLSILLPTAKPTVKEDYWMCATKNYSSFFNPPLPTGTLLSAIMSYSDKLLESCTEPICPYPEASEWCVFATAAPTAVLPAYSSHASIASLWWEDLSSSAIELAEICPHYWYDALTDDPSSAAWLNNTIIMGECAAKVSPSGASSTLRSPVETTPTAVSSVKSTFTGQSPVETSYVPSPDETCGGTNHYICPGSGFGECCSEYGWCGLEIAHCDPSGCQLTYGHCAAPSKVSPDGTCGGTNGYECVGSGFGDCCSGYNWCGSEISHCSAGCQDEFGSCSASVNMLAESLPINTVMPPTRVGVALSTVIATKSN